MSRRQKNNPCLIGEAGVGKTAIAEGIAQRIAEGKVPARLQDKEIYLLDMTSLVAGTSSAASLSSVSRASSARSRLRATSSCLLMRSTPSSARATPTLYERRQHHEARTVPRADAGHRRNDVCEYRKYIEKDSALERRFQPVKVEEPSLLDTIEVIKHPRLL